MVAYVAILIAVAFAICVNARDDDVEGVTEICREMNSNLHGRGYNVNYHCCERECDQIMKPYETKYGLKNPGYHVVRHCDCDADVLKCLQSDGPSATATVYQRCFHQENCPKGQRCPGKPYSFAYETIDVPIGWSVVG